MSLSVIRNEFLYLFEKSFFLKTATGDLLVADLCLQIPVPQPGREANLGRKVSFQHGLATTMELSEVCSISKS